MVSETRDKVPGPGSYHAKTDIIFKNFGSSKFGSETRPGMNSAQHAKTPAPNAYKRDSKSCVQRSAPSFCFGASKRPQSDAGFRVPGPGTYPLKTIIGTESVGKSLAKRLETIKTSNQLAPGPGTYEPKTT